MLPTLSHLAYDRPVAVIGDIHGESALLDRLLPLIGDRPLLVVGDLGDRGPDTRGVIDRLVERDARGVRGNHDEWLVRWASGGGFDTFALHRVMGGRATLDSYGVAATSPGEIEAQRWRVPGAHVEFLSRLALAVDLEVLGERYWLLHAGVPGSVDLAGLEPEQIVPMLVRAHASRLAWEKTAPEAMPDVGRTVIMGHVPQPLARDGGSVIALDTGAGRAGGALTAVLLPERRFVVAT